MANVKTHLNKILNAIYGKDVRSAIHDSIEAMNTEVETHTQAEASRVQAELERQKKEGLREEQERVRKNEEQKRIEQEARRVHAYAELQTELYKRSEEINKALENLQSLTLDESLTKETAAAQAKATGKALRLIEEHLSEFEEELVSQRQRIEKLSGEIKGTHAQLRFGSLSAIDTTHDWVAEQAGFMHVFINKSQTAQKESFTLRILSSELNGFDSHMRFGVYIPPTLEEYAQSYVIPVVKSYSYRFSSSPNIRAYALFYPLELTP